MRVLVINNQTLYLDKLLKLLDGNKVVVRDFRRINDVKIGEFEMVILSGSYKYSVVNHLDVYAKEIELIKKVRSPVIGICLGFELIAYTFGGKLKRLQEKVKGMVNIKVINDPLGIFKNLPNFKVYESHRWVVSEDSDQLIALAESKYGIEAVKHKTKPIFGFQFHPEMMIDQTAGDEIFANLMARLTNNKV